MDKAKIGKFIAKNVLGDIVLAGAIGAAGTFIGEKVISKSKKQTKEGLKNRAEELYFEEKLTRTEKYYIDELIASRRYNLAEFTLNQAYNDHSEED